MAETLAGAKPARKVDEAATLSSDSETLDIQSLIDRAKKGDRHSFALLYRGHVHLVYRYLAYRLPNRSLAEDLTAEVFLRALRKISDFQWRGVEFSAWLVRIARNVLLDHLKSAGNRLEVVGIEGTGIENATVPGSDLEALDRLDRQALYKALNSLRPEHQEVLYLRFLQGLSTTEVGKIMEKTEGAIRVLQFRALKALLRVLKAQGAAFEGPRHMEAVSKGD